jgi:hypothetical protein
MGDWSVSDMDVCLFYLAAGYLKSLNQTFPSKQSTGSEMQGQYQLLSL